MAVVTQQVVAAICLLVIMKADEFSTQLIGTESYGTQLFDTFTEIFYYFAPVTRDPSDAVEVALSS